MSEYEPRHGLRIVYVAGTIIATVGAQAIAPFHDNGPMYVCGAALAPSCTAETPHPENRGGGGDNRPAQFERAVTSTNTATLAPLDAADILDMVQRHSA